MITRCKYVCQAVTKRQHWSRKELFLYEASFSIVADGSEENKKFFEATPSGNLNIGTYKEDLFLPGKSYYLDISEAGE